MSLFDDLFDAFDDATDMVFDRDAYRARRDMREATETLKALGPVLEAASRRPAPARWRCRRCRHVNAARFCGGCGREKNSPLPEG